MNARPAGQPTPFRRLAVRRPRANSPRWRLALTRTAARSLLTGALWLLTAATSDARPGGWFGSWILDRTHSHLTATTLVIGRTPRGYHFDFGATQFDIGDDGADYPTVPNRTTSLKAVGPRTWVRVHKIAGRAVDHSTLALSEDDQDLLIQLTATDARGKTQVLVDHERRVGPGHGLAGHWRSADSGLNVSAEIVLAASGGAMKRSFPLEGQFYVAAPNGAPAPYQGPRAVSGVRVALRAISSSELRWTESINGKPYTFGIDRLSDDGRHLTEITWPAAQPSERQTAVYRRHETRRDGP